MGYYAGDFYAGARGDPGFLQSMWGLAKAGVGMIPGVGPMASAALSKIGRGGAATAGRSMMVRAGEAISKHPAITAAAAAGAGGLAVVGGKSLMGGRKCKHTRMSKRLGREVCVRRMNACNPRALRRAIRRTHAFARLAMKTIHIVHPKKKGRFGGFKKRRSK